MSKRRLSETDDVVINNNKRSNKQTFIQPANQSDNQSTDAADSSSSNSPISNAVNQPIVKSSQSSHSETSEVKPLDGSGDDCADEDDFEADNEYEFGIASMSDYTIHFTDIGNRRASLHLHRLVLVSMSKFFEAFFQGEEKVTSICDITGKCSEPGHRCFSWDGTEIGGEVIGASELTEFFCSMYVAFDGSGRSSSLLDEQRHSMLYHIDHSSVYLYIVKQVLEKNNTRYIRYDCWDYHGAFELVHSHSHGVPPAVGAMSFFLHDDEPMNWLGEQEEHLSYHLANYFQCDSLMKLYENAAIEVIKQMMGRSNHKGFTFAWLMLGIADKYKWKDLRSHCLSVVALDSSCRSRPNWRRYATSLCVDTLADAFAACAERR